MQKFTANLLAQASSSTAVIISLAVLLAVFVLLSAGLLAAYFIKKKVDKKRLGVAEEKAAKVLADAEAEAKKLKRESYLESKEEANRLRQETERENKERRNEISRAEQRVAQKEESVSRKEAALDKKLEDIDAVKQRNAQKEQELAEKEQAVEELKTKIGEELEKVAGLSREEAKQQLIALIENDARRDAAVKVREIEQNAKDEADKKAKDIVSQAIQRCAVDHSSDITVSVVSLPNDDMKGRIIGREGRNIRALENATGIDLIIDDTPEAVILSGFDPVRREVARISLEKLINDGRIHPARIEEVVDKTRREVENSIKEAGESAAFDANVFNLHPELVRLLGRLKFRTSYGQNVLKHSMEVCFLAGLMAEELGADVAIARRAGLLHDIGKAVDHEVEGTHVSIGEDLAKRYKESKEVVHCIAAHHNDIEPQTLEAVLVQAADAISGARPGARRESLENYIKRLEKLEGIANSFPGVDKSFAIQAGREVRIMVKPEKVSDDATILMAKDIAKKIEQELEYPGQIKVNIIRETRTVEFAK